MLKFWPTGNCSNIVASICETYVLQLTYRYCQRDAYGNMHSQCICLYKYLWWKSFIYPGIRMIGRAWLFVQTITYKFLWRECTADIFSVSTQYPYCSEIQRNIRTRVIGQIIVSEHYITHASDRWIDCEQKLYTRMRGECLNSSQPFEYTFAFRIEYLIPATFKM